MYNPACLLQNVGLANEEGNTALHWACLNGQEQVGTLSCDSHP